MAAVLALAVLACRRAFLQRRRRAFDCSLRVPRPPGLGPTRRLGRSGPAGSMTGPATSGGWMLGLARYTGDDLEWYRVFSCSPRPKRLLPRGALLVQGRRRPDPGEAAVLPPDATVVCCRVQGVPVELGLGPDALTGLLVWLEAAPPGRRMDVA